MDGAVEDLEGAVLGQVCHRTEEAFSSTHGLLWRPIRQKKRRISTNMQHFSKPREREGKMRRKMISSPNWDLLLGGSELTEPFLPPFFLSVTLCSHAKIIRSFLKCCGSCDN